MIVIKASIKENDFVIKFQFNKVMILDIVLHFLRSQSLNHIAQIDTIKSDISHRRL